MTEQKTYTPGTLLVVRTLRFVGLNGKSSQPKLPHGQRVQVLKMWTTALGAVSYCGVARDRWLVKHIEQHGDPRDTRVFFRAKDVM